MVKSLVVVLQLMSVSFKERQCPYFDIYLICSLQVGCWR